MKNGIDESINLLKELEVRLKTKGSQGKEMRVKTQQDEHHNREEKHWGERVASAVEYTEGKLEEENRELRRYVNRLIKMNDYLKNQLIKGQQFSQSFKKRDSDNPQIQMLKMEIEYLKELNREKDLQIELMRRSQSQFKGKTIHLEENIPRKGMSSCRNVLNSCKNTLKKPGSLNKKKLTNSTPLSSTKKKKCRLCYC